MLKKKKIETETLKTKTIDVQKIIYKGKEIDLSNLNNNNNNSNSSTVVGNELNISPTVTNYVYVYKNTINIQDVKLCVKEGVTENEIGLVNGIIILNEDRSAVLIVSLFVYLTNDVVNKCPYFTALCNFLFSEMLQYQENGFTYSLISKYNNNNHPVILFQFNEPITSSSELFLEIGN